VLDVEIEIRRVETNDEYRECVALQKRVWGADFSEEVPLAILKVGQRIGGVTAAAFAPDGRMLGFVFGLTGIERGKLVHWSDMLAVVPEARSAGLGKRLKDFQRRQLEPMGVETMYWTFDPLVARNAHLNLERLGAAAVEYVVDMYGSDTSSDLHRGVGTDRLVVAWAISTRTTPAEKPAASDGDEVRPLVRSLPSGVPAIDLEAAAGRPAALSIEVPADIEAIQRDSIERAGEWRSLTRSGFVSALAEGYRIAGFRRSSDTTPGFYLLRLGNG